MDETSAIEFGTGPSFPERPMKAEEKRLARRIAAAIGKRSAVTHDFEDGDITVMIGSYGFIDVTCRAGLLKAPFRSRPLSIQAFQRKSPRIPEQVLWDAYGETIAELMTSPARASEMMRKMTDRIERILSGTGMELVRYHPTQVGRESISIEATIRMVDANLDDCEAVFHLEHGVSKYTMRNFQSLKREAKAQAARVGRRQGGHVTDAIMYAALSIMTTREQRKLETFIREQAGRDRRYVDEYRNKELADRGLNVPEVIETLKVKDGIISGRVRISPNATFNRNRILIAGHLPQSFVQKAAGMRLGDIVQHPWVPGDVIVEECKTHNADRTAIRIAVPQVHFPSGIPVPDKE